ncbi:MAG TPA: LLM class flavin-dependent oxidoreductase [Egibacteraceae bacterium]
MEFGLLLPHFGRHASRATVLEGARRAEEAGFDSVFVRDHLVYEPHAGIEDDDPTFYDPLTTLTAIGATTERISLGTGALIPFRHPVHLARILGTMIALVGPRIHLGLGTGRFEREFAIAGLAGVPRLELVKATVAILRTLHHEGRVSHVDDVYAFDDVAVEPRPGPLEIWYCGSAPAAARLAVDLGLAWLPGRITLDTITARRAAMEARASDAGVAVPKVGVIAPTSIAATRDRALEGLDVDGLLDWANTYGRWWVKPASGRFQTRADLKGSLIAGSPDDVASEVADFQAAGVDHLVFDLRSRFDRWFESIDLLASEVLPRFREAAA